MENPYEFYNNKLGVKIGFLIFDRNAHPESLGVISYNALNKRVISQTCTETQLRRASLNYDALVLYSSLCQNWKDSLTMKFGNPKTEIKKSFFASHFEADRKAWDFYNAYTYGEDNRKVKDDDQLALIDELLAKHTNLDYTQVANIYNSVAERLYWKTITPQTVANRKQDANLVVYAGRNGANALSNYVLMQNKRTAPTKPMLFWTLDGWDAELLYQKTGINKEGKKVTTYHNRLTAVMVVDPYNKYIIGYAIGSHENPALIKAALRNAFQHSQELFGDYYRPYQLQCDRYQIKALTPLYEACSSHFTPTKAKNAKAKIIEPFFNRFNKEYCQMMDNWSGHNVNSGSNSQPNSEYMNKIKNQFPDERGCFKQLISAIEMDRAKKQAAYVSQWQEVATEFKSELTLPMYLRYLGETTNYTNRLQGQGLTPTINGQTFTYDSFDLNFRKLAHLDWAVQYDPQDLSKVLVTNANSRNGKLVDIVGTYEFLLEQKHIQPMALAERTEGDALKLTEVKNYNSNVMQYITDERQSNIQVLEEMFSNPLLNDTLAKHLLTDSRGQHKDHKSENRLQAKTQHLIEVQEVKEKKQLVTNWNQDQDAYNKSRTNINDYL